MLSMPVIPNKSPHVMEKRTKRSNIEEKNQNRLMMELGIDPYEFDIKKECTEEERQIIHEALKRILSNQELSRELREEVKKITGV